MGWYQFYWVYGAGSLAIDTSEWQLLLVSMIPHLQARKCSVICRPIFFSLTTDINRVSQKPLVAVAAQTTTAITNNLPVRVDFFLLLAVYEFPFVSRHWLFWWKVNRAKCGSSFVFRLVTLQANFCILWIFKEWYSFSVSLGDLANTLYPIAL